MVLVMLRCVTMRQVTSRNGWYECVLSLQEVKAHWRHKQGLQQNTLLTSA